MYHRHSKYKVTFSPSIAYKPTKDSSPILIICSFLTVEKC